YCNGALEAPNCIPPRFDVWQTKPCFAQCVSNCNNVGVTECSTRYKSVVNLRMSVEPSVSDAVWLSLDSTLPT
ncbi:unnamed protein product, partial [Auanema sp. JU1783]